MSVVLVGIISRPETYYASLTASREVKFIDKYFVLRYKKVLAFASQGELFGRTDAPRV